MEKEGERSQCRFKKEGDWREGLIKSRRKDLGASGGWRRKGSRGKS